MKNQKISIIFICLIGIMTLTANVNAVFNCSDYECINSALDNLTVDLTNVNSTVNSLTLSLNETNNSVNNQSTYLNILWNDKLANLTNEILENLSDVVDAEILRNDNLNSSIINLTVSLNNTNSTVNGLTVSVDDLTNKTLLNTIDINTLTADVDDINDELLIIQDNISNLSDNVNTATVNTSITLLDYVIIFILIIVCIFAISKFFVHKSN